MIINPLFLPETQSSVAQADVDALMQGGTPGDGAFPVSFDGNWHGGLHLRANAPVYALADGVVHYVKQPTPKPSQPTQDDPLNYHGWSSDGVVVIKHQTEIGENAKLTWYAVYQHLSEIGAESQIGRPASKPAQGQKIWRKAIVGKPGWILGQPNKVQLDIVLQDDGLKALLGRAPDTPLDPGKPGRTDCVWGECYVHLPAGTKVYTEDMREAQRATHAAAGADAAHARATYAALLDGGTPLGAALVVGIDYRQGACTLTCYHPEGGTLGDPVREAGSYEYGLYAEAIALYPDGAEAGYQLLRFGRVLNGATQPQDTAHWRQIRLPAGGTGWVNLNVQGTTKFSDADFPPWQYWRCVDDDQNIDSRCDSAIIKKIVMGEVPYDRHTFDRRLKMQDVQTQLARTLCKMPSEWNSTQIDDRLRWLTQPDAPEHSCLLDNPLSEASYARLKAHVQKLCFWDQTELEPTRMWHISPREFVRTMQRCGWLSQDEMIQLFPETAMRKSHGQWVSEGVTPGSAAMPIQSVYTDLNKACRRYGIVTPARMAAFYANAEVESRWFSTLIEGIPKRRETVDGHEVWVKVFSRYYPWIGRGFLQLTWPDNYIKYWQFKGKTLDATLVHALQHAQEQVEYRHKHRLPDQGQPLAEVEARVTATMRGWRDSVSDAGHPATATDSAGAYWAWSAAAKDADQISANHCTSERVDNYPEAYYKNNTLREVAITINGGLYGIVARLQAYTACQMTLFDVTAFPDRDGNILLTPVDYRQRRP